MKNKKTIIIASAASLLLVLSVGLTAYFHIQLIKQKETAEVAKRYQSVPVSKKINKDIVKKQNYTLACKLINANIKTMDYWDSKGSQALASDFIKDYNGEFEIKVDNDKAIIQGKDYQVINKVAYLTLYHNGFYNAADNSITISIDPQSGNGFFTWTEMFLAESKLTSAVISCGEK